MNIKDIITESHHTCPHCGGPVVEYSGLMEKKDACYYKVKASAKVWPSAYASGRLVQCRKKGAANYGNKSEGVAEGSENFNGIDISMKKEDDEIMVRATAGGRELGHVLFVEEGEYLMPQDLEVEERFQGQGIAAAMYDYVKSKGYKIRRSGQQTDAGAGFWDKHKSGKNVWEQGVAEAQLDEKCWDGYQQQGMKNKGGRQVPNCVPTESVELSEEFDLIESIIEGIAEHNGVDAETVWADLESLTEDELYAFAVTSQLNEDWQKANKRDKTDGMSQKAVNAYRRENPGSKLKTAVTTKPSKLKKGGKASKRRKSYCSRSRGQMKMHSISCAKTPDKAICKARRRWNC
jgi:hypothetical protein